LFFFKKGMIQLPHSPQVVFVCFQNFESPSLKNFLQIVKSLIVTSVESIVLLFHEAGGVANRHDFSTFFLEKKKKKKKKSKDLLSHLHKPKCKSNTQRIRYKVFFSKNEGMTSNFFLSSFLLFTFFLKSFLFLFFKKYLTKRY